MSTAHELLDDLTGAGRQLREKIPGVYAGYAKMSAAAMGEDGELPARMRELITLAIGVTRECDGCIAAHARGAARQGASEQEVAEALGVAILMNGGPGTVWAPRAYAAFREFAADR
ncbi:MAG TPA: carboxymuconolactone decarboxylase family protein [Streptosporangiaceae bacterium]